MWSKGHKPNIDDRELQDAIKKFNMMESGFSIGTDELPAYEVELINLVKAKINDREMENQSKLRQKMNGVT